MPVRPAELARLGYLWIAVEGLGVDGSWALTAMGLLLDNLLDPDIMPASGEPG
ncbi:MAG: hypothetical protein R3C97_06300 [Geminicoccaceae bacterium]